MMPDVCVHCSVLDVSFCFFFYAALFSGPLHRLECCSAYFVAQSKTSVVALFLYFRSYRPTECVLVLHPRAFCLLFLHSSLFLNGAILGSLLFQYELLSSLGDTLWICIKRIPMLQYNHVLYCSSLRWENPASLLL
jgi:hypothetical protein